MRTVSHRELSIDCGLANGLGWRVGEAAVLVRQLTVKVATSLQLASLHALRWQYYRAFVDVFAPLEERGNPDAENVHCTAVAAAQRQLWKLKWDNHFKEVYWRLVMNGLPTAERMHLAHAHCMCDITKVGPPPGRRHHFWDCPIAKGVVHVLQQQLSAIPSGALKPHHVLCMECPAPSLHKGVWRVVCLAAVNAMALGCSASNQQGAERAAELRQQAAAAATQLAAVFPQRLITAYTQPTPLTPAQQQHNEQVRQHRQLQEQQQQQQQHLVAADHLAAVCQQAVSRFWELLHDFVALGATPRKWLPDISPSHPFLRVIDEVVSVHCVAAEPDAT
jgi:hypothetical protein